MYCLETNLPSCALQVKERHFLNLCIKSKKYLSCGNSTNAILEFILHPDRWGAKLSSYADLYSTLLKRENVESAPQNARDKNTQSQIDYCTDDCVIDVVRVGQWVMRQQLVVVVECHEASQ